MGIQNIKGTGLDFVYRWVSLDTTTRALGLALSNLPAERERGIRDSALARRLRAPRRLARAGEAEERRGIKETACTTR